MKNVLAPRDQDCNAGVDGKVIPVDIAAAKAEAVAKPICEFEALELTVAAGRVLAKDQLAGLDLPPFDNSAMDGYAVSTNSFAGTGPWPLSVVGRIAAGASASQQTVEAGVAFRIFTGAQVPPGCDAVLMQEHVERVDSGKIMVSRRPRSGENIRRHGEDVSSGTAILRQGEVLTPQRMALLAAQGVAEIEVWRRVRIGLISTGSELREPGEPLGTGQIYNSNRIMVRAMLSPLPWVEIVDFGIIPDRREALVAAFSKATRSCDVLLTTGGVSAGEEDHVVAALDHHGGKLDVLKVAMRPGKPVKIGVIGDMLFAGLPGNPNAALVTLRQIALPAIRAVGGLNATKPSWQAAVAGFAYDKRLGRTEYVPVRSVGTDEQNRPILEMLGRGSSASLSAMANADGIALLPPDLAAIAPGTPLRFEALHV